MTDQEAKEKLLRQECDLAVVTDAVDLSNVRETFLFKSQYCVLINNKNPLSRKEYIQADDYCGQSIIGKDQTLQYYWRDMNFTIRAGSEYAFFVELNNAAVRERLVQQNAGIAVAWDYTCLSGRNIEGCTIRPMDKEGFGCKIYLIESDRKVTAARARITETVKQEICRWVRERAEQSR